MRQEETGTEAVDVAPSLNQSGFPDDLPEDFTQAIQTLANEQGVTLKDGVIDESEAVEPEPEPAQPLADKSDSADESAEAEVIPAPVLEVPEKFQKEDGTVDVARVEKSTLSAEAALLKYRETEKALHQAQNQAKQQQDTYTKPEGMIPQPENLDTIAKQIEDEIKLNGTGVALAKLMNAISETTYQRSQADLSGLQGELAGQREQKELQRIAEQDSWALTEQGFDTLSVLRQENPWINQSPSPWKTALEVAKGRGLAPSQTQSGSGVPIPKPKGQIVTPSSGARTVQPIVKSTLEGLSGDALNKALDKLPEKEQDAFWKSKGFPDWR